MGKRKFFDCLLLFQSGFHSLVFPYLFNLLRDALSQDFFEQIILLIKFVDQKSDCFNVLFYVAYHGVDKLLFTRSHTFNELLSGILRKNRVQILANVFFRLRLPTALSNTKRRVEQFVKRVILMLKITSLDFESAFTVLNLYLPLLVESFN
jgi:hypothetical protein